MGRGVKERREIFGLRARRQAPIPHRVGNGAKVALVAALVVGAFMTAATCGTTQSFWVAWITLLPLILIIRTFRPLHAMVCGAAWGMFLFCFSGFGAASSISATPGAFALLTGTVAIYAGIGATLTRWIGFNPFVLSVAWMAAELAIAPSARCRAVFDWNQMDAGWIGYVGPALGYVLVAFIVTLANASLVYLLSGVRFGVGGARYGRTSRDRGQRLFGKIPPCLSHDAYPTCQPRGPPLFTMLPLHDN